MNKSFLKLARISLLAAVMLIFESHEVRAGEKIDFPEEELAQETVLPRFDRPDVVKRRNVSTNGRFEFGGYYGWNILEPIQNQSKLGINIGYHLSEESALMVNYANWMSGLNSQYTNGLAESPNNLDFSRAPKLKSSMYAHYEWKIFYGKISFTKQGVLNLSTYPIFGAGLTSYEHKTYYGLDCGIGQKFYFGKSVALRADFKLQYGQKPSPFLQGQMRNTDALPTPSAFADKWDLGTIMDIGFSFLL